MAESTSLAQWLHDRVAGLGGASTIWGIVIGTLADAVVTIVNAVATNPAIDPKLGHIFAIVATIVGALWPAPDPKPAAVLPETKKP